jgi:hypothetical protein
VSWNITPRTAAPFQAHARALLEARFHDVREEWRSSADANDAFRSDRKRYAPRVDLAVGPFNTNPGGATIGFERSEDAVGDWFVGLEKNPNPRCVIAIEIVFNGSAKHVLGDILNASVLGLYGLIICSERMQPRVERNLEYLQTLTSVGKLPSLFQNILVMTADDFDSRVSVLPSAAVTN